VILDEYVVMPNHVHGIIVIADPVSKDYQVNSFQKIIPSSIGSIIRGYKIGVTKWFRANSSTQKPWQRNFYETVIRDDKHFTNTQNYILNNLINWKTDDLNI
jgi:REP element-mobilizing transposase RayT